MTLKHMGTIAVVAVTMIGLSLVGFSVQVVGQETTDTLTPPRLSSESVAAETHLLPALSDLPAAEHSTNVRLQKAAQVAAALDQELLLEFNDAPLSEVVDYLKIACRISIVIDRRALDEIGLESAAPVTCSFSDITLRSSLPLLLATLDLDYVIRNEVLLITTKEVARTQLDPRVYAIDDLQIEPIKLVQLITHMVAPETWEETGGTGRIDSLDGARQGLVIAQTDQIHDQIADFLEKLRPAKND